MKKLLGALGEQELTDQLHALLRFLVMGHVAGVFESHPLALRDQVEEGCDDEVLGLLIRSIVDQCSY